MDSIIGIGECIPPVQLTDLSGCRRSVGESRGQILILNFWSAECPWSERADVLLVEALSTWSGRVVLWTVAANANEPDDLIRTEAKRRGLPLVLRDPDQTLVNRLGALTTPHVFVLDDSGRLRYRGAIDDVTFRKRNPSVNYVRQAVEALLAGESPDPAETLAYGCTIVRNLGVAAWDSE